MDAEGSPPHPNPDERLAADSRWLRELAERLIGEPQLADDACQDAWLLAQERQPERREGRRSLLFNAMRRAAWRQRRAERTRRHHEASSARSEALPATAELLARGEARRRLWQRLAELDEPYRTVLLLKFQEGLDTAAIAARSGSPQDTVRSRLRRGLELLRQRYRRDDEDGGVRNAGWNALAVAALPLGRAETSTAITAAATSGASILTTILGAILMKKTLLAAGSAVVLGVLWTSTQWTILPTSSADRPTAVSPHETAVADSTASVEPSVEPVAAASPARSEVQPDKEAADRQQPAPSTCRLTGSVVDINDSPIAGAQLELREGIPYTRKAPDWEIETASEADGSFSFEPIENQQRETITLSASASAMHTRARIRFGSGQSSDRAPLRNGVIDIGRIQLAPAGVVVGQLVDPAGVAVEDARVIADGWSEVAQSDHDGRFRLEHLLGGPTPILIERPGFLVIQREVDVGTGTVLDLGQIHCATAPRVTGQVVDSNGTPVANAKVTTRGFRRGWVFDVDAQGRFDVPVAKSGSARLYARAVGYKQSERPVEALPGESGLRITLGVDSPRGRFFIADEATDQPITEFGLSILQGYGSKAKPGERSFGWNEPTPQDHPNASTSADCLAGRDLVVVIAPGYARLKIEVTDEATLRDGQRILLRASPGVTGSLVTADGRPDRSQAQISLLIGRLARVTDVENDGTAIPLDPGAPLTAALRNQGSYSIYDLLAVDRPLPPLLHDDWGGFSQHKAQADADGKFHFDSASAGIGRIVATQPDGSMLDCGLFVIPENGQLDVGALRFVRPGTLRGRLLTSLPCDLNGTTVTIGALDQAPVTVSADGSFVIDGIPPGDYALTVEPGPAVHSPTTGPDRYFVRINAGDDRNVTITLPTLASCTLTATVTVNGSSLSADVTFRRPGTEHDVGTVHCDATGRGVGYVQADILLDATINIEGQPAAIISAITLPSGAAERSFAIETAGIEFRLPDGVALRQTDELRYIWTDTKGTASSPRPLYTNVENVVLGNVATGDLRIRLAHAPLQARAFLIEKRDRNADRDRPWQRLGRCTAQLTPEAVTSAQLR